MFVAAYNSLTVTQKNAFARLLKGYEAINPYDELMAYRMLEVGLEHLTYLELMESYPINVHLPLNETIPISRNSDNDFRGELKTIYQNREYFKTIKYYHSDISSWLI